MTSLLRTSRILLLLLISQTVVASDSLDTLIAAAPGRETYPYANLVVIHDRYRLTLEQGGGQRVRAEYLAKALTRSGADSLTHYTVEFDSRYDTVVVEAARVRQPDGAWLTVPPESLRVSAVREAQWAAAYSYLRQLTVAFSPVVPGAAIQLAYRMEPLPGSPQPRPAATGGDFIFGGREPVLEHTCVLETMAGQRIRYEQHNSAREPLVATKDDRTIYMWDERDCPPYNPGPQGAPIEFVAPRVLWTTFPDWEALGVAAAGPFWDAVDASVAAVDGYLATTTALVLGTPALMNAVMWVRNQVRTADLPSPRVGFQSRTADQIFETRYGHPLEKAVLLTALLRAYGFGPMPVLVPGRNAPLSELPVLEQFRHVILAVPADDDTLWLDPIAVDYPPDVVPYADTYGQGCLLVAGAPMLVEVPMGPLESRGARTETRTTLSASGELSGFVICEPQGDRAAQARRLFAGLSQAAREDVGRRAAATLSPHGRMVGMSISGVDDLTAPVAVQLRFDAPYYAARDSNRMVIQVPPVPFEFAATGFDAKPDTVSYPVQLPHRGRFVMTFAFVLPDGYRVAQAPPPLIVDNPYLHLAITIRPTEQSWTWEQILEIKRDTVPAEDYSIVREAFVAVAAPRNQQIVLEPKPAKKPASGRSRGRKR